MRAPGAEPLPGTPEYKLRRAEPRMKKYDQMSAQHRALIDEFGDGVFMGLAMGMCAQDIRSIAKENDGVFRL